jgi:hypothetical protein
MGMNKNNPIYLILRAAALLSPIIALQILEIFILPPDYFTFRVWEAAVSPYDRFPGGFYPNLNIYREKEYGDRYRSGGGYVQYKTVHWVTDPRGWRNRSDVYGARIYDVVTLGDSNIVGSFMDQRDTLAETMSRKSGLNVYNYSDGYKHIKYYFSDKRMSEKGTKLVVIESKVGNWLSTNDYLTNFTKTNGGALEVIDSAKDFIEDFDVNKGEGETNKRILQSRIKKQILYNRIRSELLIDSATPSSLQQITSRDKNQSWRLINAVKTIYEGRNPKSKWAIWR